MSIEHIREIKRNRFSKDDLYLVDVLLNLRCVDNEDSFSYYYKDKIHFKYYKNTKLLLVSSTIHHHHKVRLYYSDTVRLFTEVISDVGDCKYYNLK